MRIGHGYDAHRLVPHRRLVLGGVEIPYERGLLGHSDADVLTHAVIDALLGAAALGDIGGMFPDSDVQYKDIDSMELLVRAYGRVAEAGLRVGNLDCTVIAERPKLAAFVPQMKARIAAALGVSFERVNVKATTEEGMGFTGIGEGIAAHAVILLEEN